MLYGDHEDGGSNNAPKRGQKNCKLEISMTTLDLEHRSKWRRYGERI